ncbi:FAD-binding dehydrogenase [Roseobacter sp. HKCCD9010]|uniref:FAD-binding dehydrogenase n=1 Tax=unclassified Roseobacter TaxID=196798 RepID=UPI0014924A1C|nr:MULTISPECIES: FAD-binding dehydrogenase [unclassified Roseobacter]MBF9049881.1 FAD-binding dehydrogenase [Rhodobacterales bacterium HKCCD4356]NNV13580.1 FAD-binding dehydrogenase [Roseobacter sp. HKCCD7357]NNV16414.1 FAD-binding dehydrogenase [Roseobacter sp. HKCCD8768]NNV25873.1 FAD-binding dehydrogenase [Roseobacter sp. HKCCD8192]NNV30131.1 FAD-binding dehydrogenase [Roseobacter sp. HKCCD9061]
MKTVAEITDGRVTNIARIKADAPVPYGWVECTDAVCIGDLFDGQAFTAPAAPAVPVIPFEEAKASAIATVYDTHASYLRQATDNATPEERDTWPAKSAAATAYLAGTATAAQIAFMDAAAARDGVTPDGLAGTIITKADAYLGHIGQADDLRASGRAAVEAATTHDALQAALDAFEAEAQAAFDALGAEGG